MKDGKEIISVSEVQSYSNSQQWISDIKYSEKHMAAGSYDGIIYLYGYEETTYQLITKLTGHSSFITHLDFSIDGKYIQSNSGAFELFFWNTETNTQILNPNLARDVQWATWTCTLGWAVQGIYSGVSDDGDINAVCRSFSVTDETETETLLLAVGNDYGQVKFGIII